MGYLARVKVASFLTGVAVASAMGIYALHHDYKNAHQNLSQQVPLPFTFWLFAFSYHFFDFIWFLIKHVNLCVCVYSLIELDCA